MEGVAGPEDFDAEVYLRLAGERELLAGQDDADRTSPLAAAAHALVAIGATPAELAQAVLDDYRFARACRESGQPVHFQFTPPPPKVFGALRAVPCGRDIEQPWGWLTIDFLVLAEHETTLHVRMRLAPPPPPGPGVFDSPFLGALTLTDNRGTTTEARFSGGGSGVAWSGEYTARHPLAWDAEWIEVLGERIELATRAGVAAQVRIEPLAEPDPARRYLRAVLGGMVHYEDGVLAQEALAAVLAAGALAEDDPEISAARAVLTWHAHDRSQPPGHGPLPEPWRSLRHPALDGPAGLAVVGAVTPEFDGLRVAVLAVESAQEQFSITVETAPGVESSPYGPDDPVVAWWAADDRGHYYLGESTDWHWDASHAGGRVEFSAPIDPAATVLELMPTTPAARAVIAIPLDWA
jgi:hypothetical protein